MKNLLLLCAFFFPISLFGQTSALIKPNQTVISASVSAGGSLEVTNTASGGAAIFGKATSGSGVVGQSLDTNPLGITYGIAGTNLSQNFLGYGVYGSHNGTGNGVRGNAPFGTGVYGNTNAGYGIIGSASSSAGIGGFFTSPGSALITATGNVGIGGTPNINTDEIIDINGRIRIRHNANTAGIWFNNSTNTITSNDGAFIGLSNASPGSEVLGMWLNGNWRFLLDRAGNVTFMGGGFFNGSGTFTGLVCASNISCISDIRFKKNIVPLENSLANLLKINGLRYDWRKEEFPERNFSDKNQIGFIAQEIEKIYPEMVFTDAQGYKSVEYAKLTPVLVEAVKEQQKQIEILKEKVNEIDQLKSEMASLKNLLQQTLQEK